MSHLFSKKETMQNHLNRVFHSKTFQNFQNDTFELAITKIIKI